MMTFLLVFTVLQTAVNSDFDYSSMACFAIGLAVFLGHSFLIPNDGCSINPTRSFGPAVVEYIVPAPAVFYAVPAQVVEYLAPPPVAYTALAATPVCAATANDADAEAYVDGEVHAACTRTVVETEEGFSFDVAFWEGAIRFGGTMPPSRNLPRSLVCERELDGACSSHASRERTGRSCGLRWSSSQQHSNAVSTHLRASTEWRSFFP